MSGWSRTCGLALLLLVFAASMQGPVRANEAAERARVFEITDETDFANLVERERLRTGDVIVLPALKLIRPYGLTHELPPGDNEPVYVVGRTFYEHVLRRRGLTKADIESRREARRILVDELSIPSSDVGAGKPGSQLDPRILTPLSGPQLTFLQGSWVFAGFDLGGHTDLGDLIVVGRRTRTPVRPVTMLFAANRISNCDAAFENCLWAGMRADGEKRNGGTLIRVMPNSVETLVSNNMFEHLRGFVLVFVEIGSINTQVAHNTFRHLRPWGDNAAEAVHLGIGLPVRAHDEEPPFGRLNSLVAYNLFEDASAEGELIGVKTSGERIIGNRIVNSFSGISLRDGRDTLIEGNTIIRSYGIRVMGDRQIVRNNHIIMPIRNYGIWFENGASRAGYECILTRHSDGREEWRPATGRLTWYYRRARDPVVTGNTVKVPPGGEKTAIAPRNFDKPCGWDRCDGKSASQIACDRQLSDAEMARILDSAAGNEVHTVSGQ